MYSQFIFLYYIEVTLILEYLSTSLTYFNTLSREVTRVDKHITLSLEVYRSSRPEVFCRKGVLRKFAKFTGKHRPATLLKKRLWHRFFPVNFAKFLRTPFLTEHLRWLLLSILAILGILSADYITASLTHKNNFKMKIREHLLRLFHSTCMNTYIENLRHNNQNF